MRAGIAGKLTKIVVAEVGLTFGKAWPATAAVATCIAALALSGQVQEVAFGTVESIILGSLYAGAFRWIGWSQYAALWLGSGLAALAVARAARSLLTEVRPLRRLAWPLNRPCIAPALPAARRLLPGHLSALLLLAVHGAFALEAMRAFYSYPMLMLVALSAVLFVFHAGVALWMHVRGRNAVACRRAAAAAVVVSVPLAWLAVARLDLAGLACALSVVLPVAAFVHRPSLLRVRWRTAAICIGLPYLLLWTPAARWAWLLGSLALVLIVVAVIVVAATAVVLVWRTRARPASAAAFAVVAVVCVVLVFGGEKLGRETLETPAAGGSSSAGTIYATTRADRERYADVAFAIHSDGGGLRAALYTASVLALADDLSCGEFGSHVFAASGVSGGALGISTWAVLRQEYVRRGGAWAGCVPIPAVTPLELTVNGYPSFPPDRFPLAARVRMTLAQDHLSSVIAKALTIDLLPSYVRSTASRGQALLESWQAAATQSLGSADGSDVEGFARRLSAVDAGASPRPILALSATSVTTGSPVVFTNDTQLSSAMRAASAAPVATTPPAVASTTVASAASASSSAPTASAAAVPEYSAAASPDLQIGVAALDSARFPLVSPAGDFGNGTIVVDGGYYDNSGADTLERLLARPHPALTIVRIEGNPPPGDALACERYVAQSLLDPGSRVAVAPEGASWAKQRVREIDAQVLEMTSSYTWSATSAYIEARGAHADQEARDLVRRHTPSGSPDPLRLRLTAHPELALPCEMPDAQCISVRMAGCRALTRPAPLGWYMSEMAAGSMQLPEAAAALQLVHRLHKPSRYVKE